MATDSTRVNLHCNQCLGDRWHTILHSTSKEFHEDGESDYIEVNTYKLAQCNGCDDISLHTGWSNDGNFHYEQWPPKLTRRRPKWLYELFANGGYNGQMYWSMQELYRSIGANNLHLTVLGVRSLIEHMMIERVGSDHGNFVANLNAFHSRGSISVDQMEALKPVIDAGHASTHRGFRPSEEDVNSIMDVLENVIESVYINKQKAESLQIPPKPPKPPKAPQELPLTPIQAPKVRGLDIDPVQPKTDKS